MPTKGTTYTPSETQLRNLAKARANSFGPLLLDSCKGGRVAAKKRKSQRDAQVKRKVSRYVSITQLRDVRFRPLLNTLARVTILLERTYAHLRDRENLASQSGELTRSIDTVRRLADTQLRFLQAIGLTPMSSMPEPLRDGSDDGIEAALTRMERIKVIRDESNSMARLVKKTPPALEAAKSDLAAYASVLYRRFELPPHLKLLVEALEAVERGEVDRLMIFKPPRHGKSLLTSQLFPAWYLGRNPTKSIIASSYGAQLATDFGRKVRNFVHERLHKRIVSDCTIAGDSDSRSRFNLTAGGSYYALGAGGAITGRGADLLLVDDPIKSAQDANSATFRRSMQQWYESVAYSRLEPNGSIVIVQTLWHCDDLAGWLLREHSDEKWKVISLPAIAEPGDLLGRREGEALWSERFDLAALARIRSAIGTSSWLAEYQQRPVAEEGSIFKKDWFPSFGGPLEVSRTVFSLDCAFKTGQQNDYSVILVISETKSVLHIRLVSRGRWEYPELQRRAVALAAIWRPNAVLVEDAASGQSLIQSLKAETLLPILPVKPMGDKVSRANAVSPMVESGRVILPTDAPWLSDFLEEVTSFPSAPHDDITDALTQALSYLRGSTFDSAGFQKAVAAHERMLSARRRGAPAFGQMVMNARDQEDFEDSGGGAMVNGFQYTNRGRVGRWSSW